MGYSGDGGAALFAKFNGPKGIAYSPEGALYISDTENHVIRRVDLRNGMISTVVGTLCAYGLWKRGSHLVTGTLYLSLVTPEIVTGISLLALFQWIFRWLHWHLGLYTVILAHVAFSIAYVVIVVSARLRTVSRSLEEAAMDLGANEWQAFFYVILPALGPGIVAAALLALTVSFDDFVITSMVAGVDSETLPMVIYAMARRGASPVINAISALVTVFFGIFILISERIREA